MEMKEKKGCKGLEEEVRESLRFHEKRMEGEERNRELGATECGWPGPF